MMDFFNDSTRKARKEHLCDCCKKVILPGEEYVCQSGKYGGEFFYHKYCKFCEAYINEFCRSGGYDEYEYDWLDDYATDTICRDCSCYEACAFKRDHCILQCPILRKRLNDEMELGVE